MSKRKGYKDFCRMIAKLSGEEIGRLLGMYYNQRRMEEVAVYYMIEGIPGNDLEEIDRTYNEVYSLYMAIVADRKRNKKHEQI